MTNRWPLSGLAALSALFVSLAVSAQDAAEWTCVQGDLQRRVAIFYETGVAVPCEVQYFKDTEAPGEQQVLWRALNESGYCESQAEGFIEQLQGWGWACSAAAPAEAVEPEEIVDDTDDLAPATEADPGN